MTLEEYIEQPFKTNGVAEVIYNKEFFSELPRRVKREIKAELTKGRYPHLEDYIDVALFDEQIEKPYKKYA